MTEVAFRDDGSHTGVMLNWIQHLFAGEDLSCDKEIPDQVRDDGGGVSG